MLSIYHNVSDDLNVARFMNGFSGDAGGYVCGACANCDVINDWKEGNNGPVESQPRHRASNRRRFNTKP